MPCGWMQVLMDEGGEELLAYTPKNGDTCLFTAAKEGHVDVVKVRRSRPWGTSTCALTLEHIHSRP